MMKKIMENKKYFCNNCSCGEFITNPNRYDIFKNINGKLIFEKSEAIDEKMTLFCRDCSAEILINEDDIVYNYEL